MTVTNADILTYLQLKVHPELEEAKVHLATLNGSVEAQGRDIAENKAALKELPCQERGTDIVRLQEQVKLNPRDVKLAEMEVHQAAHKINWNRVWQVGSALIIAGLLLALQFK